MPANKLLLLLFICVINSIAYSQKTVERYYDFEMRETFADRAKFYSMLKSTDSGWFENSYFMIKKTLYMVGLYKDNEKHVKDGSFYWFYPNGKIKRMGKYVNNKREGTWLSFYSDNSLKDSLNYKNGEPISVSLRWYRTGMIEDSLNMDDHGSGVEVSWFDDGQPSAAGKFHNFKQHGTWQYFHKNGRLSSEEVYDHDSLKTRKYFDENGVRNMDTASKDHQPLFPGGDKAWHKFIMDHIYFPSNYEINTHVAEVVVTAMVNEDGQVIDPEVTIPLHPEFDKIVLKAVMASPHWIPAVSHNRKVYDEILQTVSFTESYNGL